MNPDRLLRRTARTRWLVTLHDNQTFEGLLLDADRTHLVLVDAESLASNGDRLAVDGELWIPRANVAYMQMPKGGARP